MISNGIFFYDVQIKFALCRKLIEVGVIAKKADLILPNLRKVFLRRVQLGKHGIQSALAVNRAAMFVVRRTVERDI